MNKQNPSSRRRPAEQGKVRVWLLVVLAAAGVAAGAWWWHRTHAASASAGTEAGQDGGAAGAADGKSGGKPGGRRGGNAVQPVAVMPVSRRDVHVQVNAIGSFVASNTAVVHAQVSGVLQQLHFQEGQTVRAGQTLAQIDPRGFQATQQQAEGNLARDKAQLDNARLDLVRYQGLLAKDALPRQQLDTQEALVRQLEGTVKADQATVDAARLQVGYTRVLAPISGRVGLKQVDIGNVVQPGDANGIVTITQTRPMALVFAVPAASLPQIAAGLREGRPLAVQALDPASKTPLAQGRVATIDNAIDAATDTIKIKALFPNEDERLFPNQSVSVTLQVDTLSGVLAVPSAAVLRGASGFYVFVVGADSKVATRVVKPGAVDAGWTAVEGELKEGERVVVDGVDRLREGAKVEVVAADPAQRAGGAGVAHAGGAAGHGGRAGHGPGKRQGPTQSQGKAGEGEGSRQP